MENLTKEYFDETIKDTIKGLATHFDQQLDQRLSKQSQEIKGFVTQQIGVLRIELKEEIGVLRADVKEQIGALKTELKEEVEGLARMVAEGFQDIIHRFDFKEPIEKLEHDFAELKQALRV